MSEESESGGYGISDVRKLLGFLERGKGRERWVDHKERIGERDRKIL